MAQNMDLYIIRTRCANFILTYIEMENDVSLLQEENIAMTCFY